MPHKIATYDSKLDKGKPHWHEGAEVAWELYVHVAWWSSRVRKFGCLWISLIMDLDISNSKYEKKCD